MTTAVLTTRPSAVALGRVAAGLAVASAVVHLLLLDASLGSLVMFAMAAACLPCAWHLWQNPTGSVWCFTALVDGAMLVLHAQMLGGSDGHEHIHHAAAPSSLMWLGLALVGGQLALAGAAVRRPWSRTAGSAVPGPHHRVPGAALCLLGLQL
ncbi:hypothetical protein [Modestobacter sp. I12A-02662]|uniref:hypothetical protein n=1 Tax=Modestobacter sp. I12A-02662 TaxID=1730496 RepID=UPI0034E018DD